MSSASCPELGNDATLRICRFFLEQIDQKIVEIDCTVKRRVTNYESGCS